MALKRTTIRRASKATLALWVFFNVMTVSVAAQEADLAAAAQDAASATDTGSNDQINSATPATEPTSTPEAALPAEATAEVTPPSETTTNSAVDETTAAIEPVDDKTPVTEPDTSVVSTGDAIAVADGEIVANVNSSTASGSLSDANVTCPNLEGEIECAADITAVNDNTATASGEVTAAAVSGQNENSGSAGSATTETGDATAVGRETTEINQNSLILVPGEMASTPTETPVSSPTQDLELACDEGSEAVDEVKSPPISSPITDITLENNNSALETNNVNVSAVSGNNVTSENVDKALTDTGDALALAEVLNVVNTNIVASQVAIVHLNLEVFSGSDIDLNEIWKQIISIDDSGMLQVEDPKASYKLWMSVENGNTADLVNTIRVNAVSGGNVSNNNGAAETSTGDATALANVTNIVNTNILGSKFVWGTINIFAPQSLNIIFPRPTWFLPSVEQEGSGGVNVQNSNSAEIENSVSTAANSGNNLAGTITGTTETTSGGATAVTNTVNIVNTDINLNNWFLLMLNNMGDWSGKIVGWNSPTDVITPNLGVNIFDSSSGMLNLNADTAGEDNPFEMRNKNTGSVVNDIQVTADTGNNKSVDNLGNTAITTGTAKALANLMNIVNTNIVGSRWFWANVNILGNWSGNAIFAYPDVALNIVKSRDALLPGEHAEYRLMMNNSGRDEARGVKVKLNLPAGMNFVTDTGNLAGGCSDTSCTWEVGDLQPGEKSEMGVVLRVDDNFSFERSQAFWSRLIPAAKAGNEQRSREIDVNGYVYTLDPETDTGNNSANAISVVYEKLAEPETGAQTVDARQPILAVTAKNNVNNFVYPGDTVTFEIKIKNSGPVPAYQSVLVQKVYDEKGRYIGSSMFELGTINSGKEGKMNFGLTIPAKAPGGKYRTVAQVVGKALNGQTVSSGEAETWFTVKGRTAAVAALPQGETEATPADVLGAATFSAGPMCEKEENVWLLVMLSMYSSVLFGSRVGKKRE